MFALIDAAGWPVWFLIAASIAALALVLERSWALQRARVLPAGLLDQVLGLVRSGRCGPETLGRLREHSPLGSLLAAAIAAHRDAHPPLREAIEDAGRAVAHDLERYLSALGTVATVAPLLGLFGTVIGMIEIFGAQAPGGGDPQQLARGISIALYNTAFGLAIAIPALIAYRHFRARVDDLLIRLEAQALTLVQTLEATRTPR